MKRQCYMIDPFVIAANKAAKLIKNINKKIYICCSCGKEFKITYPNACTLYCSTACRKNHKIYEYKCTTCGKIFNRNIPIKTINVFCCDKCKSKFRNKKVKIKKDSSC